MTSRDHGGGLDAAIARYGGSRSDWLDLSTGINPVPYPLPPLPADAWTALPDSAAQNALEQAARSFWNVPAGADILAASGASVLIAMTPRLASPARVRISAPTYNEHAAAFAQHGWTVTDGPSEAQIAVHPNNPTGALWTGARDTGLLILDESFCDTMPAASKIAMAADGNTVVLKSFGKFWGLAGLRLGFAIGAPALIEKLRCWLGPWPVAGPALALGRVALTDPDWAQATLLRLETDAARLDETLLGAGAALDGGTPLFRLYRVDDAQAWQTRLAEHRIWSRTFPYSVTWLRLGLPAPGRWQQLEAAL